MSDNMNDTLKDHTWFYQSGEWSVIKNSEPLLTSTNPRYTTRRQSLGEYNRVWLKLGPEPIPYDYSGLLASVYSYTGSGKAPRYLVRIVSLSSEEVIYVEDFPDLLEILTLLTPLVSNGIFADAYVQRPRR